MAKMHYLKKIAKIACAFNFLHSNFRLHVSIRYQLWSLR